MLNFEHIQQQIISDRLLTAAIAGLFLGVSAAVIGLLLAIGGPVLAIAAVLGLALGLYILTNLDAALYLTLLLIALLPYGTLPVKIALVPTLIDITLGCFLLVYVFQWMTGKRTGFKLVPVHVLILVFIGFTIFSFVAGLGNAPPTTSVLRKFVELLLAIGMSIVIVDVARDEQAIRRIVLVIVVGGALQALVGLALYVINDETAERILNILSRFGYPSGNVLRYINDDPTLPERAIGTFIDPNSYGGFLMMAASIAGLQMLAPRPVTGKRWIIVLIFGLLSLAVWVTNSRGALVALAAVLFFVAALRYRWLLVMLMLAAVLIMFLPFTQDYLDRFTEGVTGQDLSTQMRLGEYKDALILIGRYPILGVGFTGTPDRDIYLGVSMLYLKIAGGMGLIGLAMFLAIMLEVFRYGFARWSALKASPSLLNLWMGFAGGLFGALVSGIFDHYYFNIEYQAISILFWTFAGLSLAAARLASEQQLTA